jgi:hypothetical protein
VGIDRRSALVIASGMLVGCTLHTARGQNSSVFDPVAMAKLRAGEIAREIAKSNRDASVPAPSSDEIFSTGLLLQAGLRALLPVQQRQGIALPGAPSPSDPEDLVVAQDNYKGVFESGAEATPAQKAMALKSIELATEQLRKAGYTSLAAWMAEWLRTQGPAQ